MSELFTENGINTEVLQAHLGDEYYNDPETKQQPTKIFDNVKDEKTLLSNYAKAQRKISKGDAEYAEKTKGMVKVPDEKATADEIKAFRKANQVPDTPDGYKLNMPKTEDKEEQAAYGALAAIIKNAAHEEGINPKNIGKTWDKIVEGMQASKAAIEKAGKELIQKDIDELKAEQKENYQPFLDDCEKGLAKFNIDGKGTGDNFKKLLVASGLYDTAPVKRMLFEIAKLVLPEGTHLGRGTTPNAEQKGVFSDEEYLKTT